MLFFFFSSRRRHTRSLRDWSSDVCSSDLDRLAAALVANDEATVARPVGQQPFESLRRPQFGHGEPLALLSRLDRMYAQSLEIDPLRLSAPCPHRPQRCDAKLGRLLDQPVEPRPLYLRKQEPG